jgi:outer membrane lipoprotein-sorting protein
VQVKIFLSAFMLLCSFSYAAAPTANNRLQAIERYFNSFRTLKAKFTQLNPDGSQSAGSFYLWRPGRMRLNYEEINGRRKNPRQMHIIVANGDTLYDHNAEYDETTEIPLDATPAGFILRENIRFSGDIEVTHLEEKKGLIFLSLVKRDDPDAGTLTLVFNADPLTLIEWEILDSQKVPTRVMLDAIETGVKLDPRMFEVKL